MFPRRKKENNQQFADKLTEYNETVKKLRALQENISAHLEMTKKYVESCSTLAVQIAFFFGQCEEDVNKRTSLYGQLNSELEDTVMKSVSTLYKEEILQPIDVLWVSDKEIQELLKKRKRLIAAEQKRKKAHEKVVSEKTSTEEAINIEQKTGKPYKKGMMGKKRRSITEVNREVIERKRDWEEAKQERKHLTDLIVKKFDSLENNKKNGELLASPLAGLVASQYHLAAQTVTRLRQTRKLFRGAPVYEKTLAQYDIASLEGANLETETSDVPKGFAYRVRLTETTPDIVCDCIEYIRLGIRAEGLFRIPGNRIKVERIQQAYDRKEHDILNERTDIEVHDVCSALKLYFNLLPEPLIPYNIYKELESYFNKERGGNFQEMEIIKKVRKVPSPNIAVLGLLLNFLFDVKDQSRYNQMTSANLATCFAPVLLRAKPETDDKGNKINNLRGVKNIATTIATVTVLIDNARQFGVPSQNKVKQHTNLSTETRKRVVRKYQEVVKLQAQQHHMVAPATPKIEEPDTSILRSAPNGRSVKKNLRNATSLSHKDIQELLSSQPNLLESNGASDGQKKKSEAPPVPAPRTRKMMIKRQPQTPVDNGKVMEARVSPSPPAHLPPGFEPEVPVMNGNGDEIDDEL